MDIQSVPLQNTCLGCKRYFLLNQKLPLQSMTIQLKNYSFPIKQSYLKKTLLKAIVGFMNSKGGIIFMGVDDSSGQVVGVNLGRKEMDEFKLMIKQMLEKVEPAVDLIKQEQVSVQFIPILQGKERYFYGKYVIKFIVLQGDPSKLYCISQKVKSDSRFEETQVIAAYRRHALGGIQEIKGIKVIHEIYEKARNPHKIAKTFHENCNPHPICPMIIERPKLPNEKVPKIFADEDSGQSHQSQKDQSQSSQHGTIIDKIEEIQKINRVEKPQNVYKIAPDNGYNVYFQNIKQANIKSFMNYLKNSTPAKYALEVIQYSHGIVRAKFNRKSQKQSLLDHLQKQTSRRIMNDFGINQKVNILNSLNSVSKGAPKQSPQQRQHSSKQKLQNNHHYGYSLLFYDYNSNYEGSVENYLKNCINANILRKRRRTRDGLLYCFESKRDMNSFYDVCGQRSHTRQLSQFWPKGHIKIKRISPQKKDNVEKQQIKIPDTKNHKDQQSQQKIIQEKHFPTLIEVKIQEQPRSTKNNIESLELIASSLEPLQVPKLTNYLINNMFYNIQKKILASKDRFYIRIVFNCSEDCKEFMKYCNLDQHKQMLAQFSGSKNIRIGIPGENLLISPYSDTVKEDLKKVIVKVLGVGAIKKSNIKEIGDGKKVWSLTLVDTSMLMEYYEKLEIFLRKENFYINQEWVRFKVFLDYKNLCQ